MLITAPSAFTAWADAALVVAEHVKECPVFSMQDQIKRAARRFFILSGIWRSAEQTLLTTVASTQGYAHTPPTNGELVRVYSAWSGEDELEVELPGESEDAPSATTESEDTRLRIGVRDAKFWVSPMPSTADIVIKGTAIYAPTAAGAGIPSHAWEEWGPEIAAGAAAKLVAQPERPWSAPTRVGILQSMFDRAVTSASNQAGPVRRRPLRVKVW